MSVGMAGYDGGQSIEGGRTPQYMYYPRHSGSIPGSVSLPQTPFDPVYGITLLPSHLVMGSPFVNTPQSGVSGAGSSNVMKLRNPSMGNFYPPAPALRPAPIGRNRRKHKSPVSSSQHKSANDSSAEDSYEQNSVSKNGSKTESALGSVSGSSGNSVDCESPITLNYSILPKGSDTYRSRSLLFSKVSSKLDLLTFLKTVVKSYPIESIYLIPTKDTESDDGVQNINITNNTSHRHHHHKQNIHGNSTNDHNDNNDNNNNNNSLNNLNPSHRSSVTNGDTRDDNSELENKHTYAETGHVSYLLSFLTKETCLDFYNNLLQRFAEVKQHLKSDSLTMNFVRIEANERMLDLKLNVITLGASRSLYIELDKEVTVDNVWDLLPMLRDSKRYVVINADLVNTEEKRKHFGSHYCILHLISISMAVEIKSLLESEADSVSRVSFVIESEDKDVENKRKNSVISLKNESSRTSIIDGRYSAMKSRSSNISLPLSERNSSVSVDLSRSLTFSSSNDELAQLPWYTLTVNPDHYDKPIITKLDYHPIEWSISKPATVYMNNDTDTNTISSGNLSDDMVNPLSVQNHETIPQEMLINDYPYIMEPLMPPQITQTLQHQYNKSIQAVNAGMEHRTVYIGNINPRSRPEDICNVVRGGILQHIKWVQHKRICFVTFIETAAAVQFYANAILEPIVLHGSVLKVGWGQNPGPLPKKIALAVTVGASRNVYVSLPDIAFKDKYMSDPKFLEFKEKYKLPNIHQLKQDFNSYGPMEQVNFHTDGHCCWINFLNINSAIKLVEEFNDAKARVKFDEKFDNRYEGLIIGYGKDRCGNVNKNLVSNKSSRHNKKGSKPKYENRSNSSVDKLKNPLDIPNSLPKVDERQFLSLTKSGFSEGLGITISPNARRSSTLSDNEEDLSDYPGAGSTLCSLQEVEANDTAKDKAKDKNLEDEDLESASSYSHSSSSDVDIIVTARSPKPAAHATFTPVRGSAPAYAFVDAQPYVPTSHFEPHFASQYQNRHHPQKKFSSASSFDDPSFKPKKTNSKPIAGSDVMTRYLEQLHHNTFLYAANILGATQDPVFYDEDNV